MTVKDIEALVGSVDPQSRHYYNPHDGTNYTRWMEYKQIGEAADDTYGTGWKFQIDRYTKQEYDPIAADLEKALKEKVGVAYRYMVDFEQDSGYIHHIFDCEGV